MVHNFVIVGRRLPHKNTDKLVVLGSFFFFFLQSVLQLVRRNEKKNVDPVVFGIFMLYVCATFP